MQPEGRAWAWQGVAGQAMGSRDMGSIDVHWHGWSVGSRHPLPTRPASCACCSVLANAPLAAAAAAVLCRRRASSLHRSIAPSLPPSLPHSLAADADTASPRHAQPRPYCYRRATSRTRPLPAVICTAAVAIPHAHAHALPAAAPVPHSRAPSPMFLESTRLLTPTLTHALCSPRRLLRSLRHPLTACARTEPPWLDGPFRLHARNLHLLLVVHTHPMPPWSPQLREPPTVVRWRLDAK